jgi:hypothetical protein
MTPQEYWETVKDLGDEALLGMIGMERVAKLAFAAGVCEGIERQHAATQMRLSGLPTPPPQFQSTAAVIEMIKRETGAR